MDNSLLNEVLRGTSFALFDGAMGTMLVREGLAAGELPELLCLEQPQKIASIHRSYVQAGSQFVTTNTFGANRLKLGDAADVAQVFQAAEIFAKAEGILPAPESSHAIRAAIDEALKCKQTGEEKVIVFNLSGTGYFDLYAYAQYNDKTMNDVIPSDKVIEEALAKLPKVPNI